MVIIKGDRRNTSLKRRLRSEMTEPERRLWSRLKSRQFLGLKFRKQHGIGGYIVDFYCPQNALVVEIDGDSHGEDKQITKDEKRDANLRALGVIVVRYTNEDVMHRMDGVLEDLKNRLDLPPPAPPYKGGE